MILNRENKYKGHLEIDEITFLNNHGREVRREVMVKKNAVAAIVYDTIKQKYIFVSQYRVGSSCELIEIVAGTMDHAGEDSRETIIREIKEEIGYEVDKIKLIDECYVSPGGCTEIISIYYCEVSKKVSEGGGLADEDEEIEIIEMSREEMLKTRFKDAKTIIGIDWIKNNKPEINENKSEIFKKFLESSQMYIDELLNNKNLIIIDLYDTLVYFKIKHRPYKILDLNNDAMRINKIPDIPENKKDEFYRLLKADYENLSLMENSIELLEYLKSKCDNLVLLTNLSFLYKFGVTKFDLEKYFTKIFYSFETGFLKPEKEAFEDVLKAMNKTPQESIMIGNSDRDDKAGAESVGMDFINIENLKNNLKLNAKI